MDGYLNTAGVIETTDKMLVTDKDGTQFVIYKTKMDGTESKAYEEWKLNRSKQYKILYNKNGMERKITSLIPISPAYWADITEARKSN